MNKIPAFKNFDFTTDAPSLALLNTYVEKDTLTRIKKHYSNGLSRYIEKVHVEIVSDIQRCKVLWDQFSPNKSLFDLWEFRLTFNRAYGLEPYFILIKKKDESVALLPLAFYKSKNIYWWFGGEWQEDNIFFSKDPYYIPLMLFLAPKPLSLWGIKENYERSVFKNLEFSLDDSKYTLDLAKNRTIESFLKSLKKKKRHNLKRDRAHIENMNPKIVINNLADFKEINKIVLTRFHQKGELAYYEEEPLTNTAFEKLIAGKFKTFETRIFSIYINGRCVASDVNAYHNSYYYTLMGGYNVEKYPGIGNYIFLKEIEDALALGMRKIDFLQEDYGWKHKWFSEEKLLKFEKP